MSSYANPDDLFQRGLPESALGDMEIAQIQAALDSASTLADGYMNNRVDVPLKTPGDDVIDAVCAIAAWRLLCRRGFSPESSADSAVRMRYEDSIEWLKLVSSGKVTPQSVEAAAGPDGLGGPVVVQPTVTGTDGSGLPIVTTGAPSARGW